MPKQFWRSLRSRILLLAVLTFLFLAGAAISFFAFLRSSHTAELSLAERHLMTVASNLTHNYADRPSWIPDLSTTRQSGSDHPPPPPPPEPIGPGVLNPPSPPPPAERMDAGGLAPLPAPPPRPHSPGTEPLAQLTARTLRQEPGIEGGFYVASSEALVGYSFPTHEGPGPNKEMPQRERPTIEQLVKDTVAKGSTRTSRFEGPHDAILFVAMPIREIPIGSAATGETSPKITGAVWLMQRIPGVTGGRNRQLLWGSIGFGSAALITALLTFFVTTEVSRGVNVVLARLGSLESGLFAKRPPEQESHHLEEFDRVLRGIDILAASLQQKIEKERSLEAEMRHKERLSALGQFAAGIAHELRNPLATIRLRTQMTQRSSGLEGVSRNSNVILEEIDRLDSIIGRLLYFSRPINLQLQPVSLNEICCAATEIWKGRESAKGVDIVCATALIVDVLCDRSRMLQVLDNLLENAIHSASAGGNSGGKVWVSVGQHDGTAEIEVHDNGPGLDANALNHALDPFFTTKDTGTGLGLSISFEIVQAHGGGLQLSNHPEGGAVASIRLPIPCVEPIDEHITAAEGEHNHG